MASIFSYQSSDVDWCEKNFQYSELVAEFYNTISNVPFFIFGPLMIYLLHPYARKRSLKVHLVLVLFILIGLFSSYFHMTLSFFGQILDELSILWLLATSYCLWFPRCYFPAFLKKNRSLFSCMVLVISVIITFLAFIKPVVNAYMLNCSALHLCYFARLEYKKNNPKVNHMIRVAVMLWAMAISTWICDKLFCPFFQRINFTYLHSFWHILISMAFPYILTIIIIVDGHYEMQNVPLEIHYWPRDDWIVGLPYVTLQDDKAKNETKSC